MAVPEGYTKLGRIGFVDKGYYDAKTQYDKGDVVLYKGSSYIALKDGMTGVTPVDDKKNWRYMARGFEADRLEHITASDVQKLCGKLDYDPDAQSLIDVIADLVANKLLKREDVVANLTTATAGKALDATQGKVLKDTINDVAKYLQVTDDRSKSNKDNISTLNKTITQLNSDMSKQSPFFDDTAGADEKEMLRNKIQALSGKPDGMYQIFGGWKGHTFGFSIAQVSSGYIQVFFVSPFQILFAQKSSDGQFLYKRAEISDF